MTDIVERLRNRDEWGWLPWWDEAADEIERLRGRLPELRADLVEKDKAYLREMAKTVTRQAEIERLRTALAVMWHAYDSDNRPPHHVVKIARECFESARKEIARLTETR